MFAEILKSLSDCHETHIQALQKEISDNKACISSLKSQIESLKEEKFTEKLLNQEMLDKIKELESFKTLYFDTLSKFKHLQDNYEQKQNSWNKFKQKVKNSISRKKLNLSLVMDNNSQAKERQEVSEKDKNLITESDANEIIETHQISDTDHIPSTPSQKINVQNDKSQKENVPMGTNQSVDTSNVYSVSKLKKGPHRDLSIAESMPWAQKKKDLDSRPDYAYQEVIRKKHDRKRLDASDCPCCKEVYFDVHNEKFYKATGLPDVVEHEGRQVDRIQLVSRHRFVHKDPETPDGYWDLDYNALYSTDEENDTKEGKRKRLEALEAQKKSKIS